MIGLKKKRFARHHNEFVINAWVSISNISSSHNSGEMLFYANYRKVTDIHIMKLDFLILQIILFSAFMLDTNHKIIHVTPLKKIFWHGKTFNYTINEFLSPSLAPALKVIIICIVVFCSIVRKLIFHLSARSLHEAHE